MVPDSHPQRGTVGTLVHDADCGFCQRMLRLARRAKVTCSDIPSVALTDRQLQDWELTRADVDEAAWFIGPDVRLRGHEAIAAGLGTSELAVVRWLGRLVGSRALRPIAAPAYAWVANHRHQLPGGTPACALGDSPGSNSAGSPHRAQPTPRPRAGEDHR